MRAGPPSAAPTPSTGIVRTEMTGLTDTIAVVVAVGQERGIVLGGFHEGFIDECRQRWLDLVNDLDVSVLCPAD